MAEDKKLPEDKKSSSSLKLAFKDLKAEATGSGILALLLILFLIVWITAGSGTLLQ